MDQPFDLRLGDSREVLRGLPDNSVDSVVTDPPYALESIVKRFGGENAAPAQEGRDGAFARASRGFMGQAWDTGETAFDPDFWRDVLRVLKPGGWLLAFGGSRTYDQLAAPIRAAGFDIRDMIVWMYGSGMPKSHDTERAVAMAMCTCAGRHFMRALPANPEPGDHVCEASPESLIWDGWGTALKPAIEPICVGRKPMAGTMAENIADWGVGALNIDGCRIGTGENLNGGAYSEGGRESLPGDERDAAGQGMFAAGAGRLPGQFVAPPGRWPANVMHDGSAAVRAAFPQAAGQKRPVTGEERSHRTQNAYGDFGATRNGAEPRDAGGSAARFFASCPLDDEDLATLAFIYCGKAARRDRNEGCEHLAAGPPHWSSGDQRPGTFQSEGTDKTSPNNHPTVKPTGLMRDLIRLVTPAGGLVLDPFMGSGSTGKAAMMEGMRFLGVEREAPYFGIATARVAFGLKAGRGVAAPRPTSAAAKPALPQLDLFAAE